MDISSGNPLTPQHPGLAEALADPFNRAVWELLRRRGRASTVAELSMLALATREQVGAALSRLESTGLVKRAFEPGTRRRTAYKIARERLVIVYDQQDASQTAAAEAIRAQVLRHGRSVLETARSQAAQHTDEAFEMHRSLSLSTDEFAELRRRMRAVTDYIDEVERAAEDGPHLCNYHMAVEVRPLRQLVLPTASLHVIEGGSVRRDRAEGAAAGEQRPGNRRSAKVLSPREREVGRLLGEGSSCPEIAAQLGLSVNTVRTITKRLYAKVGIRRRAELVNWLRGP